MSAVFPCSWSDRTRVEVLEPCCPRCEAPLALHQPDSQVPHRLLAVCESCTAWYISDARGVLLTPIPVAYEPRPVRLRRLR
jgi:hypothetical protein